MQSTGLQAAQPQATMSGTLQLPATSSNLAFRSFGMICPRLLLDTFAQNAALSCVVLKMPTTAVARQCNGWYAASMLVSASWYDLAPGYAFEGFLIAHTSETVCASTDFHSSILFCSCINSLCVLGIVVPHSFKTIFLTVSSRSNFKAEYGLT